MALEIRAHASATMPESDSDTQIGGARDPATVVIFTPLSTRSRLRWVSSAPSDFQFVTITGRIESGVIRVDSGNLNGTTPVEGSISFTRILKIEVGAAHSGVITFEEVVTGNHIVDLPFSVSKARRIFYEVHVQDQFGSDRTAYEKIFLSNTGGDDALDASVVSVIDPINSLGFALESSLDGSDDNGAGNDRYVAPAGYVFDRTDKAIQSPDQSLSPGESQGLWISCELTAGSEATAYVYSLGLQAELAPAINPSWYVEDDYVEDDYYQYQ